MLREPLHVLPGMGHLRARLLLVFELLVWVRVEVFNTNCIFLTRERSLPSSSTSTYSLSLFSQPRLSLSLSPPTKKHSLNQKRAFGVSSARAVAWAVLFFSLSSLFGLIAFGVDYVSKLRCLASRTSAAERAKDASGGETHAETFAQSVEFCAHQYSTAWQVLTVISAVAGAAAIGLGAWRRMQMRERFRIRGSAVSDFCTWLWCSPCALCQETRTLELRGVRDGQWIGADPLLAARKQKKKEEGPAAGSAAAAAATTAPAVMEMPSKVV